MGKVQRVPSKMISHSFSATSNIQDLLKQQDLLQENYQRNEAHKQSKKIINKSTDRAMQSPDKKYNKFQPTRGGGFGYLDSNNNHNKNNNYLGLDDIGANKNNILSTNTNRSPRLDEDEQLNKAAILYDDADQDRQEVLGTSTLENFGFVSGIQPGNSSLKRQLQLQLSGYQQNKNYESLLKRSKISRAEYTSRSWRQQEIQYTDHNNIQLEGPGADEKKQKCLFCSGCSNSNCRIL